MPAARRMDNPDGKRKTNVSEAAAYLGVLEPSKYIALLELHNTSRAIGKHSYGVTLEG